MGKALWRPKQKAKIKKTQSINIDPKPRKFRQYVKIESSNKQTL